MKLTNDAINQAAAELLGLCWHAEFKPHREHPGPMRECVGCGYAVGTRQAQPGVDLPDFIHDANAVGKLVRWFMEGARPDQEDKFEEFVYGSLDALAKPPKYITLAILYAVGKITIQDACEAMEADD